MNVQSARRQEWLRSNTQANSLNLDFLDKLGPLAAGGEERPRVGQEMLIQGMS